MAKEQSVKHRQISKSQSAIVISTALAAFLVVFAGIASKALISQISYNNRVIETKRKAVSQLKTNTQTAQQLVTSYKTFVGTSTNVIGGSSGGTTPRDGDNAKIILDALPSKYDFPALTTSLEKMLLDQKLEIASIAGSDDEVAQSGMQSSPQPIAVDVPFELSAIGPYTGVQGALDTFNKSIRPFHVSTLQLSGGQSSMTVSMKGKTYYQPVKNFNVSTKVVR